MKNYIDFVEFIEQPKYLGRVWEYVKGEAAKNGFKKWQVWLYVKFYRRKRINLKQMCKKTFKLCWYVFIIFGLFVFAWDIRTLIQSTVRKNDMQSIESLIQICKDIPKFCNRAGKVWQNGI